MKKEAVPSLNFDYNQAIFLFYMLSETMLHGAESRARNKVCEVLKGLLNDFDKERLEIVDKFAKKDKDGKNEVKDNSFVFEDKEAFDKGYTELTKTFPFILDVLPSNRENLSLVKKIVVNSTKEFNFSQGAIYDQVCEKLETI